ncbi:MAG: hypothetical protein II994_06170 [Lachnospiraceae bacterium]|nr:hypothetical protein [Lachnospiraceae bacterium]
MRTENNLTIYAGNFIEKTDTQEMIAIKHQKAEEKAFKVISDTWQGDKTIDAEVEKHRKNVASLQKDIMSDKASIQELRKQQKQMQGAFGVADGSKEQKDAELLLRHQEGERLSSEERKYVEQLQEEGLTEYQSQLLVHNKDVVSYKEHMSGLEEQMKQEMTTIAAIRLERLKSSPMVKASKQAEEIKEAASEEIVDIVFEEGKEHIEEEQKKREEQAEVMEEKQEEFEARLEKWREKNEELEELTESVLEGETTAGGKDIDQIKQEVKDMVNKMKLVEEDMKGAVVDETL